MQRAVTPSKAIYTVTYGLMDPDADGNPLGWHTFLTLSKLNYKTGLMEVDAVWGFYGVPGTRTNDCIGRLKVKVSFDLDIMGNHGFLRREDIRFLALGKGLHGKTFALSAEKYDELQQKCEKIFALQNEAIEEIATRNNFQKLTKYRMYQYEQYSQLIYSIELANARDEGRPSRLHHFGLKISMTAWGPSIHKSKNCKTFAVGLLTGILKEEQIATLVSQGAHPVTPKHSGNLGFFTFFSHGPMRTYEKQRSGEKIYYRDQNDNGVKTYMIPPQQIEASEEICASLKIPENQHQNAMKAIAKLQQIEGLFFNTKLSRENFPKREQLLQKIAEHYEVFAIMKPNRNAQQFIESANQFIEELYASESFMSCLSEAGKKELCKIIEKNYVSPHDERYHERNRTIYLCSNL